MSPVVSPALVARIREEAGAFFKSARGSHDGDHTERVLRLALHIGRKEKADLGILELAALLHDIGREEEDRSHGRICHGRSGAALARVILARHGCDPATIRAVAHCIRTHRFRRGGAPKTLEARVLFDADKLDSIGAVGIGRAFQFAGEVGARLHDKDIDVRKTKPYTREDTAYREYLVKLSRVRDRMTTREGRRLAAGRHRFMAAFFARLNKEADGVL
ncbi:MAG TPA: HD domain-containing protein [Candidatus Bathyarchaeia archaeon]|nr:HD domain-containing protein [Candidatus Bathyarchaeia archaeon]